jgi:hypothetical protein
MKKLKGILSVTVLLFAVMTACQPAKVSDEKSDANESIDSTSAGHKTNVQYTCPMHPEVVADAPGVCPKCGMDLENVSGDTVGIHNDRTKHDH